ncbi:MAG: hypothetical protein AAFZ52_04775 [Bacteroidota bacterium]
MKRIANMLYFVVGGVFPILIGLLHTWVHFTELTKMEVRVALSTPVFVMGAEQPLWSTWGVMSFMMGISFVIIGLLQLLLQQQRGWQHYPLLNGILLIVLYLSAVIYVGKTFSALPQLYGGIIGMVLTLICLTATLARRE